MEPILIARSRNDLKRQFDFIKNIERSYDLKKHKKWIIIFLAISLFEVFLLTLTPSNSVVIFKGVSVTLVGLLWICAVVYTLWYITRVIRINAWINGAVVNALKRDKDYMAFDDEKLYYSSENSKMEINWNYFKGYLEDSVSIYLFPEGPILSCQSFSSSEIGHDNLKQLKQIVKERIPKVEIGYRS